MVYSHTRIIERLQQHGRYGQGLWLFVVVWLLTSCTSGDEARLRGVVATGAPVVGARITVKGTSGSPLTTVTDTQGGYTINVGTLTPPYILEASSGTVRGVANTLRLHTVATDEGIANITPLTELLVARLVQADPTTYFIHVNVPGGTNTADITDTAIAMAQTAVVNHLRALATPVDVSTLGSFITTAFAAMSGDAVDAKLEAVQQALTASRTTLDMLIDQLAPTPGGSGTCRDLFGTLVGLFTDVILRGETLHAAVFCPAQPRTEVLQTDATLSTYLFNTEAVTFTTLGGQRPAQAFSLIVNTSDGATLRSLSYSLTAMSTVRRFMVDCTSQRTECRKVIITPTTGGTMGPHAITLHDVTLSQVPEFPGGASGPGSVRLSGTLVTAP